METITCDGKQLKVLRIDERGGYLNPTTDFADRLFRDRRGRYYLEEWRQNPLPPNATYEMPRDREWVKRMEQRKVKTREISEKEALVWCADDLNDRKLWKRLVGLIERFA
jgi:hypothetical protein